MSDLRCRVGLHRAIWRGVGGAWSPLAFEVRCARCDRPLDALEARRREWARQVWRLDNGLLHRILVRLEVLESPSLGPRP